MPPIWKTRPPMSPAASPRSGGWGVVAGDAEAEDAPEPAGQHEGEGGAVHQAQLAQGGDDDVAKRPRHRLQRVERVLPVVAEEALYPPRHGVSYGRGGRRRPRARHAPAGGGGGGGG